MMEVCSVKSIVALFVLYICLEVTSGQAAVLEVGPGKTYSSVSQVPVENLQPGDTVLIHYRTNAYAEKFVLCRQGSAASPITIRGVLGPNGERPILTGDGAITRTNLNYWGETRAVIKIGGANKPADTMPRFITIENLDVRSARPPFTFTGANGTVQSYGNNAASIWIEKGANITIRNCVIRDSGNGFFVSSGDPLVSSNILVEGCHILDNGNTNSIYEHNVYTEALGITFQFNRFGPLRTGCLGNNLKDRSAGLVVRYNWIEGGNRELDLVDAEDSSTLRSAAAYRSTFVYGNVLIEPNADGNKQVVHYGGDSGTTADYRKGTLYFYNNTVVSRRPDQTTLFRFSTNEEQGDARNNIFYVTNTGRSLALVDAAGVLKLTHNWLKSGWVNSFSTLTGTINNDGSNLNATNGPGFVSEVGDDFHLVPNSICVDVGSALATNVLPVYTVTAEYVKHQGSQARFADASLDIGAFEMTPPVESWRQVTFGTNASNVNVAGDAADPDGDGICNLLEYAFSLDPRVASTNGIPRAGTLLTNGLKFLSLQFSTRPIPAGVTYVVQTSSNLLQWVDGCRYSDATNILTAGETTEVSSSGATNHTVRLTIPASVSPSRFMRVKVTKD